MAIRGRKPKHPGLEVLDGGRGKKAAKPELDLPTGYPAMPAEWKKAEGNEPAIGHPELWTQLQTIFQDNGTPIRSSDVFSIEELCDMIASVRDLRNRLSKERLARADHNPRTVKNHPLAGQLKATRDALWRAFERFGLTPVDASRLPLKSKVKTPREKVMEGFTPPTG